jgi:hypothetical protein
MQFTISDQQGIVKEVFTSKYPSGYEGKDYFFTEQTDHLALTTEGIKGERHFGYEEPADTRLKKLYTPGTMVRNNRQWTAISSQELQETAENIGVDRLTADLLGINMLIDGIERLSKLPPMTYLVISPHKEFAPQRDEDVWLVIYAEVLPCSIAGRGIGMALDREEIARTFPKGAIGHRGTTGWVEKGGIIKPGHTVFVVTSTGKA